MLQILMYSYFYFVFSLFCHLLCETEYFQPKEKRDGNENNSLAKKIDAIFISLVKFYTIGIQNTFCCNI